MPLTLRIAPELFLKRLMVGGFTKIFSNSTAASAMKELTAATTRNSPCWKPIAPAVILKPWRIWWKNSSATWRKKFCGGLQIDHKDAEGNVLYTIDLSRPWKRADYQDLIRAVAGRTGLTFPRGAPRPL